LGDATEKEYFAFKKAGDKKTRENIRKHGFDATAEDVGDDG
jgi:hypothetical protein